MEMRYRCLRSTIWYRCRMLKRPLKSKLVAILAVLSWRSPIRVPMLNWSALCLIPQHRNPRLIMWLLKTLSSLRLSRNSHLSPRRSYIEFARPVASSPLMVLLRILPLSLGLLVSSSNCLMLMPSHMYLQPNSMMLTSL